MKLPLGIVVGLLVLIATPAPAHHASSAEIGATKYFVVMLAAAGLAPVTIAAQRPPADGAAKPPVVIARGTVGLPPLPPGRPTPRMPDGHPDLTDAGRPDRAGQEERPDRELLHEQRKH